MNKKTVGFAYANSSIAIAKGYRKTGCWYLGIIRYKGDEAQPQDTNDIVYAALDRSDVLSAVPFTFDSDMEWDRYSMYTEETS